MVIKTNTEVELEFVTDLTDPRMSAVRHLRFQQAWLRETHLGDMMHSAESALSRLGPFLAVGDLVGASGVYQNLLLTIDATAQEHLPAQTAAALLVRIDAEACPVATMNDVEKLSERLLSTGISEGQLRTVVAGLKKK